MDYLRNQRYGGWGSSHNPPTMSGGRFTPCRDHCLNLAFVHSSKKYNVHSAGNIPFAFNRSAKRLLHRHYNLTDKDKRDGSISVHKNTTNPTKAWTELSLKQTVNKVVPLKPDTPITEDKLRVVCISDTHSKIEIHPEIVPDGDILIHAGDFTNVGLANEVKTFNDFLGTMKHPVKIVIAGNHDLTFDDDMVKNGRQNLKNMFGVSEKGFEQLLVKYGVQNVKELMTNCVYLEDAGIDVCGVHIYGSPWQPRFCDWGFNLDRGMECLKKWNLIPENTDILVTHGPPIGHGDMCFDGFRAGCVELLSTIQKRVKPKYHIFGHIHEGYGVTSDGHTTYINASTCTLRYKPDHEPIVFDIPIPEGHVKDELLKITPQRLIRS